MREDEDRVGFSGGSHPSKLLLGLSVGAPAPQPPQLEMPGCLSEDTQMLH